MGQLAQVSHAIPAFMQYGAMGVLASGFLTLLVLYYRSDKRSQKYADRLDEAGFDRSQLIQVVVDNTRASSALTSQIAEQIKSTDRTAVVMEQLNERLRMGRCPLLTGEENGS